MSVNHHTIIISFHVRDLLGHYAPLLTSISQLHGMYHIIPDQARLNEPRKVSRGSLNVI